MLRSISACIQASAPDDDEIIASHLEDHKEVYKRPFGLGSGGSYGGGGGGGGGGGDDLPPGSYQGIGGRSTHTVVRPTSTGVGPSVLAYHGADDLGSKHTELVINSSRLVLYDHPLFSAEDRISADLRAAYGTYHQELEVRAFVSSLSGVVDGRIDGLVGESHADQPSRVCMIHVLSFSNIFFLVLRGRSGRGVISIHIPSTLFPPVDPPTNSPTNQLTRTTRALSTATGWRRARMRWSG